MTCLADIGHKIGKGFAALGAIGALSVGGGALTLASTSQAFACNLEDFVGTLCTTAANWCPDGTLPANGQILQIQQNPALYGVIGPTYGGDGSTTFALPNLQGRSVIHAGTGPGLPAIAFGQNVGQAQTQLSIFNLPAHTHTGGYSNTDSTHAVHVPAAGGDLDVSATLAARQTPGQAQPQAGSFLGQGGSIQQQAPIYVPDGTSATEVNLGGLDVELTGTPGHGEVTFNLPNIVIGEAGHGQAFSTQSPALALTTCIVVQGLFPPRP